MKNLFKIILFSLLFTPSGIYADSVAPLPQSNQNATNNKGVINNYTLLAPLPGLLPGDGTTINLNGGLAGLLDTLYTAGIAIATGLAVLMIIFGGIEYVTTDTVGGKGGGKDKIKDALTGLLLAFMSYILLNTLNPDLLNNDLVLEEAKGVQKTTSPTNPSRPGSVVNVP